jgi:hypothetical protein
LKALLSLPKLGSFRQAGSSKDLKPEPRTPGLKARRQQVDDIFRFSLITMHKPWQVMVLACCVATPLLAQDELPDSRTRTVFAERLQGSLTIDGNPDEQAWLFADPATGFTQNEPVERQPAGENMEVRLLYDDDNLYIAAWLHDRDPSRISRLLTRRDDTPRGVDYFEISLDTNLDRLTGYTFRLTAAGVQRDRYLFNDTNADDSWNAIWHSAVQIHDWGWSLEIRLPLSQLRIEQDGPQVWGVDFARRRVADNERSHWAWTPSVVFGAVSRLGQLHGLDLPARKRRLEVQPYVMSSAEIAPAIPGDPFFDGQAYKVATGVDIRYGLGSTFIADIALNPDFGQAEVDPQVVNLGAFEIFFPERRAFFTRDDRIFDFNLSGNQNRLFHSRRIGRTPQGRPPPGSAFVDIPGQSDILGAAKITGRTMGGLSIGTLAAVTEQEVGRAWFTESESERRFIAEPRTSYGIVRVQQDLEEGASRVGGILTVVDRDLPTDGSMDFISSRAISGGMDFDYTWADRQWALSGHLAGSRVEGSTQAMTRIQRSATHFQQRPDQNYMHLDLDATSLTGHAWEMQLSRRSARFFSGNVTVGQRSPGFEVADLGFMNINERVFVSGNLQYREPIPGDLFQNYQISVNAEYNWRNSALYNPGSLDAWRDAVKMHRYNFFTNFTFLNWWSLNIGGNYRAEVSSDTLTRGGPLMIDPGFRNLFVNVSTDRRQRYSVGAFANYGNGLRGGMGYSTGFELEARPTDSLTSRLGISYNRTRDIRQYVTQQSDPTFQPTFGGRYYFAEIEREELTFDIRVNWIFSPTLSLELFMQPLISAGDFNNYKQLAQPNSFEFIRYHEGQTVQDAQGIQCLGGTLCRDGGMLYLDHNGNGRPDTSFRDQNFNLRSLRGNAVLRWEYSPGSRLFVVWQQNRQSRLTEGTLDLGRDARAMLDAPGEHMFMIKIDRWLDF